MILLEKLNNFEILGTELKNELENLKENLSDEALSIVFKKAFESEKESFLNLIFKQNQALINDEVLKLNEKNEQEINEFLLNEILNISEKLNENDEFKACFKRGINAFFAKNQNILLKNIKDELSFDEFKIYEKEALKELENELENFKASLQNELYLSAKNAPLILEKILNENKDEFYKSVDLSFLKSELITNKTLNKALNSAVSQSLGQVLNYDYLSKVIVETLQKKASEIFKEAVNNDELLNLRFLTLLNLTSLNLTSELAMITRNLDYLNALRIAELRANDKTIIINKVYDRI